MDRVAILGFGSSGQRFLEVVKKWKPSSRVLVYSSRDLALDNQASTTQLGDITAFEPQIAIVCGNAAARVEMISALPQTLRGLLIEKPLAANLELARELIGILDTTAAFVQVGYNLRFSPSLDDFRKRLEAEEFGPVQSVRAETGQFLPSWRPGRDYRSTVSAQAALGGGVLLELSHEIDYLQWLFGRIDWVSALVSQQSNLEIDVEDTAHMTLGFLPSDRGKQLVGQLNLDFFRRDSTRSLTALCASGSLRWDGVAGKVVAQAGSELDWVTVFRETASHSTYALQWSSFISALNGGSSPGATLDDGFSVLRVVTAANRSSKEGGVKIPILRERSAL